MMMTAGGASTSRWGRVATPALTLSFALLLLVGLAGPSAAKPPLGPRGLAPGDLPWSPGPALVTGLLWAAYAIGALGVGARLRGEPSVVSGAGMLGAVAARARRRLVPGANSPFAGGGGAESPFAWRRGGATAGGWGRPLGLGLLALLTAPFGSADHTNYAAYGRIAALGGDPYLTPPNAWSALDPVTSAVEPPWTGTVSIYGPVATLLQGLTSHVAGANLRETVWCWQVLVVLAWLAVRFLLLRAGATPRRVDTLWTLNPVVFGIGVLGAHVDLVAAALAMAALVLAVRRPVAAGAFAGLAVSCKITYGVVALAVLLGWWVHERAGFVTRAIAFASAALVLVIPLHLWAGPHVFDQLNRARRSISLATPWRLLYEALSGPLASGTARTVVTVLAVVAVVGFVVVFARLTRHLAPATSTGVAVRWALVLSTAYTVAAPYSLPWYDLLTWATLPVLAASVLDGILLVRLVAMAFAYVPGRVVGMTPTVERATLWVRRTPVPYAVLLVWAWLTLAARRVWSPTPEPRPPAP
ncbi:hypothetical protein BJ986_001330 [Phycicoccus badiiscoriae]|uniref:DUF2029 domain-containing protein n=1 Tax=Pedococcus badiiscoriae TaxID=642776 RepID=A0A852WCI4_9MICO|nr:hypothetical protein [Pedococcus badiiscoriae]NYG06843.1 hypothetical protein [Pedococcus badiiscoriae]